MIVEILPLKGSLEFLLQRNSIFFWVFFFFPPSSIQTDCSFIITWTRVFINSENNDLLPQPDKLLSLLSIMANYSILFLLPALNMDVTVRKPWEREVIKFDQVIFSPLYWLQRNSPNPLTVAC